MPFPARVLEDPMSRKETNAFGSVQMSFGDRVPGILPIRSSKPSPRFIDNLTYHFRDHFEEKNMEEIRSGTLNKDDLQPALPIVSLIVDDHELSESEIQARLDVDIQWLNDATNEYSRIERNIESKMKLQLLKAQKRNLMLIFDKIASTESSEYLDGLLLLGIFLNTNTEHINWDGLKVVFLEVQKFVPTLEQIQQESMYNHHDHLLVWDAACFCISRMCSGSQSILDRARSLHAVPRILFLVM